MDWRYEKPLENGNGVRYAPVNDTDGSVTGKIVMNLKAWFDENPEERIRLGWIKHISYSPEEIKQRWPYNPQTQTLIECPRQIDEYTIEDGYTVIDKSEEMLRLEEMISVLQPGVAFGVMIPNANGGVWI